MPGHKDCFWTLVHLHFTSQFHTFQGSYQSLQWNVCAAHVNNFSSNLVAECIDFRGLSGATVVTFFRINNIELKCSFVQCRKYHKSWWNGAAELHISVDTLWINGRRATQLGRFTLWHYGRLATQLSRFTLWHNRRWASQLAGKFTLWYNGRRAKQPGLMIHQE